MVTYSDVLESNKSLKSTGASPTAVFVGATSGIGRAALIALAKHTPTPRIYVVGRSQSSLATLVDHLNGLNSAATYIPIEAGDFTLLANVDKASNTIKSHGDSKLDLLIMSPGFITFAGRTESADGLDKLTVLRYYARMRFLQNLLPLLNAAPSPRVVSVLAGGAEGQLWPDDFALKEKGHYSITKAAVAAASMTTLFFDETRKKNPKIVFVHIHPGVVPHAGLGSPSEHLGWLTSQVMRRLVVPAMKLVGSSVEEAGERVLFAATNGKFKQVEGGGEGIEVGVDGKKGSGVYLVAANSDVMEPSEVLKNMREKGWGQKVVDHTLQEFERICGK